MNHKQTPQRNLKYEKKKEEICADLTLNFEIDVSAALFSWLLVFLVVGDT
jgi:hypothetical protein